MVFCTYCGQSFKRKEHLERHLPHRASNYHLYLQQRELTSKLDTNVKPFRCNSCQLSFARRYVYMRTINWPFHELKSLGIFFRSTTRPTTKSKSTTQEPTQTPFSTNAHLLHALVVQRRKQAVTKRYRALVVRRRTLYVRHDSHDGPPRGLLVLLLLPIIQLRESLRPSCHTKIASQMVVRILVMIYKWTVGSLWKKVIVTQIFCFGGIQTGNIQMLAHLSMSLQPHLTFWAMHLMVLRNY